MELELDTRILAGQGHLSYLRPRTHTAAAEYGRLNFLPRSARSMRALRAAWVVHSPVGLAVTRARWARRVPCSMRIRAYRRFSPIVSTCTKSIARMPWAWAV